MNPKMNFIKILAILLSKNLICLKTKIFRNQVIHLVLQILFCDKKILPLLKVFKNLIIEFNFQFSHLTALN